MNIVVTGLGALCSLGESTESIWSAVERGEVGIGPITRFDVSSFDVQLGATIRSGDAYETEAERLLAYGRRATDEALEQANVTDRSRVALLLGTCNGLLGSEIHQISTELAATLGLGGPSLTVSTACASSAHAIGFAAALLRQGAADYVLAGGVDTLCRDVFAGFHSLGLLSSEPCAPFSTKIGTTLGEGAAFMLLETSRTAEARGARPIAELFGFGMAADAFHDTSPDPAGAGMARAVTAALTDADVQAEDVDYFNAHGTATAANDASEWRAIQRVFNGRANQLPVSSSKSFLGHAQGAAGALEAVVTLLAMQHGAIPHTANLLQPRPNGPMDPVGGTAPRLHAVRHAICANAAFGGANAALVFGRMNGRRRPRKARSVGLIGSGAVANDRAVSRSVPRNELRGTDASARLLAGSVADALATGGFRPRTPACEGIGLFAAQARVSPESVEAFEASIRDRGLTHLSAPAFTRMVVNYATGVCGRIFGLKGPSVTLSSGRSSGLVALALAADHLAWHDDADYLVAAGVDDPAPSDDYPPAAAALLLGADQQDAGVRLSGWAVAGNRSSAIINALKMSGRSGIHQMIAAETSAAGALETVREASEKLEDGWTESVLVHCDAAAVVLEIRHCDSPE